MEQKYKDELAELGFTSNVESIGTVLRTRAYHNTFNNITDCSYAVLTMPACYDAETEKKLRNTLFSVLSDFYEQTENRQHFSAGNLRPIRIDGDCIQFEFSFVLTEKEMVDKVMNLLNLTLNAIQEVYFDLSPDQPNIQKQKHALTLFENRVKAIQLFIQSGSTSYEYNIEHYDPLD